MKRHLFDADHELFRTGFRAFLDGAAAGRHEEWERTGLVDREFWKAAGAAGFIGFEAEQEHGGLGIDDFRYNTVIAEEMAATETPGDGFVMNDIIGPYLVEFADAEQRRRWVPGYVAGETIVAIAMSEPEAGSDLAAIRTTAVPDGDELVLTGTKTFITNGARADLVLVLARSGDRTSVVAVEAGTPGFERGRTLHKVGRRSQDTAELFFEGARVPMANVIGTPGDGMTIVKRNLARERLAIAVTAVAAGRHAFDLALAHTRERKTFGKPVARHQAVMHALAELRVALDVATSHVDSCVLALNAGELTAEDAAGAKFWATELQWRVTDECLQLFGGYGYMDEYPISRLWRDARVQRIYGGTSEIMKEIVGRSLVSDA
ncbi:acyl-CoA dehydrogenase family protein [Actinophytocola oryzae]|uniref:Acyl-[acyl-carrier-protein] dehydrogenase MbtN n=1 Tax=Actinophytocola oryzae TaxID=502181 RepID=A0A4R7W109_9PSEU|nr:acyl-CoA dehydrogenase family protein [Actinophytocola oryzae]TDV56220.1 alkylation response protein AidB-like acyl-CoA dehydrogenase [Actinophytocola oryzae]